MTILIIAISAVAAAFVLAGVLTKCSGGRFSDGILIMCGVIAGANALERALGQEPRCPWDGCRYDLQHHRHRLPTTCPACGRAIWWSEGGMVPKTGRP